MDKNIVLDNLLQVWHTFTLKKNDSQDEMEIELYDINIDMLWDAIREISGIKVQSKFDTYVQRYVEDMLNVIVQDGELAYPNAVDFLLNTTIVEKNGTV